MALYPIAPLVREVLISNSATQVLWRVSGDTVTAAMADGDAAAWLEMHIWTEFDGGISAYRHRSSSLLSGNPLRMVSIPDVMVDGRLGTSGEYNTNLDFTCTTSSVVDFRCKARLLGSAQVGTSIWVATSLTQIGPLARCTISMPD